MEINLKVNIPDYIVKAMTPETVKELLEDFIENGEGIEFLKEQHEEETGVWLRD